MTFEFNLLNSVSMKPTLQNSKKTLKTLCVNFNIELNGATF